MSEYYILNDDDSVQEVDVLEWARWYEAKPGRRIVTQTAVTEKVQVSTVFLGLNHQFDPGGPPLIFETMIFGGEHNDFQVRCSTWNQAVEQHLDACLIAAEINEP